MQPLRGSVATVALGTSLLVASPSVARSQQSVSGSSGKVDSSTSGVGGANAQHTWIEASWLAWPATALVVLIVLLTLGRSVATVATRYMWRRDPPIILQPGADMVLSINLARHVTIDDRQAAAEHAEKVLVTSENPRRAMSDAPPKGAITHAELAQLRHHLGEYFERAYSAMLRSQMRALRTIAIRRSVGGNDVAVYFDQALDSGIGTDFYDWADYLDRYGFIDMSVAPARVSMTSISITKLGRLFLGWCDDKGHSPETLAASGRPY